MKAPVILIEDLGPGKHIAQNTHVYLVGEDEEGNEQKIEISSLVHRVSIDIKIGEPLRANLGVYIGGFTSRAQVEKLISTHIRPRRRWLPRFLQSRKQIEVTGFNPAGARLFYP